MRNRVEQLKAQVREILQLNIDKIIEDLKRQGNLKIQDNLDTQDIGDIEILCHGLLGHTSSEMTKMTDGNTEMTDGNNDNDQENDRKSRQQKIRDRRSRYIYPAIATLMEVKTGMEVNKGEIADNWAKIINFFSSPNNGYRLNKPAQLNDINFRASSGNQLFFPTNDAEILNHEIRGTELYENGRYFQSFHSFLTAWKAQITRLHAGNPETMIYAINSYIKSKEETLKKQNILVYTIAVVVPIHHNFGRVAKELLRGIAQLQLKINLETFSNISARQTRNLGQYLRKKLNIKNPFRSLIDQKKIALKILIVNENNTIYGENKTANHLAEIAKELNIIAVIGHYSSEMTEKAVKAYANKGLLLITPSSTSNTLRELLNSELNFYRMTTSDEFATKALTSYLSESFEKQETSQNVSIIYNPNSIYSSSFRKSIREEIDSISNLNFLNECDRLSGIYEEVKKYLNSINNSNLNVLIIIPDGGVEPLSLQNVGLITRTSSQDLIIAGGATLYHDSLLEWLEYSEISHNNNKIIVCIPWHYDSISEDNPINTFFLDFGCELWGERASKLLTWRSATAFDSVYMVVRALDRNPVNTCQELTEYIARDFRDNQRHERGVTGEIAFDNSGERSEPPTVIVKTMWDEDEQKWIFSPRN